MSITWRNFVPSWCCGSNDAMDDSDVIPPLPPKSEEIGLNNPPMSPYPSNVKKPILSEDLYANNSTEESK